MQQAKDPLNLGSLPLVSPPADDWPLVEAALRKQNKRQRMVVLAASTLAIAATVMLAVSVFSYRPLSNPGGTSGSQQLHSAQVEITASSAALKTPTLDSLITLSQQIESNLRNIRSQVRELPTSFLIYQIELEDLVVQMDEELSMQPDSVELWSQRVNLMLDLSLLYQNELRREYLRMASV